MAQGHPMSRLGGWKAIRSRMTGSSGAPANLGGSPARAGPRPGNATSRRGGGAAVRGDGGAPRGALLRPGLEDRQATRSTAARAHARPGRSRRHRSHRDGRVRDPEGPPPRHAAPNAAIVFDLSHIIAKYGRVVIDRVRGRSSERTARQSASPQARQGCALAAAEESQLDASRRGRRARRTARQP